jgi:hypothetical protein
MVGIFDTWNVSGITTNAAKNSIPFYKLAQEIYFDLDEEFDPNLISQCSILFLKLHKEFEMFFLEGRRESKTEAIKFLVAFAAFMLGKDNEPWQWESVRHLSQGLYGSMKNSPSDFIIFNMPLIKNAITEINNQRD